MYGCIMVCLFVRVLRVLRVSRVIYKKKIYKIITPFTLGTRFTRAHVNTNIQWRRMMKLIIIEEGHVNSGCWVCDVAYPKIDRKSIHQAYAAGTGEIGRHLCSINHCINPMHLVLGNVRENSQDETEKQRIFNILRHRGHKDSIPHLERTWKIMFRQLVEQGHTLNQLGIKIYTEQEEYRDILMTKLKYKKIPIIELEA